MLCMKEFIELKDYLVVKFVELDGKFGEVHARLDQHDEEFMKMNRRFDATDKTIADMYTNIDAYSKKADTYFQEMKLLNRQVGRHEDWHHQAAEKLGIELKY